MELLFSLQFYIAKLNINNDVFASIYTEILPVFAGIYTGRMLVENKIVLQVYILSDSLHHF